MSKNTQIFNHIFGQVFGTGVDQGLGEGKSIKSNDQNKEKQRTTDFSLCLLGFSYYAHIEVLVTFLLVKFFGFWVIARYRTMRF